MAKTRRKMSAKQIKHFGTKRQKAALKAKRRHAPATKRNAARKPRPSDKRRSTGRYSAYTSEEALQKALAKRKKRKNSAGRKKSTAKRRNPTPMILSWAAGNPAKRSHKVAKSRKKKRYATAKRSNAGRRRPTKVVHHRKRSRGNPGSLGRPMDWLQGGAGVIAGVVGTRAIPQMLLGASNTSYTGYAANAAAAVGLGWLTHVLLKKPVLTTAVIAGGFATLLSRIIQDKTPFGAQLSLTGLGDHGFGLYQKSNFPYPYRVQGARGPASSQFTWGDGSQGVPTLATAGSDSNAPC